MPENEGISGVSIAAIFVGGILLWSGIKGYRLSYVTQDLISGKNPQSDPRVQSSQLSVSPGGLATSLFGGLLQTLLGALNPFHLLSAGGGTTGTKGGPGGPASATVSGGFAASVLKTAGFPVTAANVASVEAWVRREGGGGVNNPLNTTLRMPGSSSFNSVGVQNYGSLSTGILATARTLLGGGYSDLIAAFKSGNGLCGRSFGGLSTWSGGGYSSVC